MCVALKCGSGSWWPSDGISLAVRSFLTCGSADDSRALEHQIPCPCNSAFHHHLSANLLISAVWFIWRTVCLILHYRCSHLPAPATHSDYSGGTVHDSTAGALYLPVNSMVSLSVAERCSLDRFKRQYFQLQAALDFPSPEHLCQDHVQQALYDELFCEALVRYRPPKRYQLRVLKELMKRIECSIDDWEEHVGELHILSHFSSCLCSVLKFIVDFLCSLH